jgi:CRP-like cAMP-binding protein
MLPALKVKTTLPIIAVKADTIIFREGGEDRRMFLVLEGSIRLYTTHDEKDTEVAMIRKHEFFGETEMYVEKPRRTSAKTAMDTKLVVIRSPRELENFATSNPWLSGKMMATMGERLAITNDLLARKIASTSGMAPAVETVLNIHGTDTSIRKVVRH